MKQVSGQMSLFDPGMPYGKTFRAHSVQTKERTSGLSLKSSARSKTTMPLFLDLRRGGSGILAEPSWEMGIPWLGECSTRVFGEYPNVAEESGLWQILEANVPQKYYLSAKACAGVLRRSERRGKELPTILKTALEQQIERWEKYGTPLPVFDVSVAGVEGIDIYNATTTGKVSKTLTSAATDIDHTPVVCYDARGNGDGKIAPTITGDHNNRITDYTSLVCETYAENSSGNGIAGTIDSHYYLGCGARGGKEREFVCIKCFSQDAYDKYTETKQSATLKATGGVYGGGSEALVCAGFSPKASPGSGGVSYENGCSATLLAGKEMGVVYCLQGNGIDRADTAGCNGKGVKENESYTLNTIDRHAVRYGEAQPHHFLMRLREGKEGGGKGALIQTDMSGTIACNNDQTLFQQTETCYIVRRLTPLECCRLQGFPDDWAKDIPHSDAQEYRMWGNGMALPNALYIMEGIADALAKDGIW